MRKFILAIAFWIAAALPAWADSKAIETTIRAQINAFQADDFERAFTYASPTIQQIFRAPDVFGRMVRQGYPMVYRPSEIAFLELATVEGYFWQKVQIRDEPGTISYYGVSNGAIGRCLAHKWCSAFTLSRDGRVSTLRYS